MGKVEIIPQSILDEVELIKQGYTVHKVRRRGRTLVNRLLQTEEMDNIIMKQLNEDPEFVKFKEWVASTQLFRCIVENSGNSDCRLEHFSENLEIQFQLSTIKITEVEELPLSILHEFYRNSPWWDENNNDNNTIKQLNNDNRISEIK